ncbi:hypothetical protein [Legionella worsleiensis]|uniref:Uncharacterized protein n=1 Tax=Legionella worsleiensis TaxID=45076 RepID=A0A0W1AEQ2_9GAMM|nr:hypothetical protein [Legionella worsleiensis]KTD79774.1 hypothetical protein Lwor_1288 [Legionella worsleiensis]STY32285.1 Uncharacterised protein [Legionella worsleiensis]
MCGDALFMFGIHAKFAQIKKSPFSKKVETHYYDDQSKRTLCGTSVRSAVEKKLLAGISTEFRTTYFDHTGAQCGTSISTFSDGYVPKYKTVYYNINGKKVGSSSSSLLKDDSEICTTTYEDDEHRIFANSKTSSAGSHSYQTSYRVDARNKVLPMREQVATTSYGSFYQQPKPKRKIPTPPPRPTPSIYIPTRSYVRPLDYPSLLACYSRYSNNPRAINAIFHPTVNIEETILMLHNRASRSPNGPAANVMKDFKIRIKTQRHTDQYFFIQIFSDEKLFSGARLPVQVLHNTKIPQARRAPPSEECCGCISRLSSLFS